LEINFCNSQRVDKIAYYNQTDLALHPKPKLLSSNNQLERQKEIRKLDTEITYKLRIFSYMKKCCLPPTEPRAGSVIFLDIGEHNVFAVFGGYNQLPLPIAALFLILLRRTNDQHVTIPDCIIDLFRAEVVLIVVNVDPDLKVAALQLFGDLLRH